MLTVQTQPAAKVFHFQGSGDQLTKLDLQHRKTGWGHTSHTYPGFILFILLPDGEWGRLRWTKREYITSLTLNFSPSKRFMDAAQFVEMNFVLRNDKEFVNPIPNSEQ